MKKILLIAAKTATITITAIIGIPIISKFIQNESITAQHLMNYYEKNPQPIPWGPIIGYTLLSIAIFAMIYCSAYMLSAAIQKTR